MEGIPYAKRRIFLLFLLALLTVGVTPSYFASGSSAFNCPSSHCVYLPATPRRPSVTLTNYTWGAQPQRTGWGTRILGKVLNDAKNAVYGVKLEAIIHPPVDGYTMTETIGFSPVPFVIPTGKASPVDFRIPNRSSDGAYYYVDSVRVITCTEDISHTYGIATTGIRIAAGIATVTVKNDLTRTIVLSQTVLWGGGDAHSKLDVYPLSVLTPTLAPGQTITLTQDLWQNPYLTADLFDAIAYGTFLP